MINSDAPKNYDLKERTSEFEKRIILFAKSLPVTPVTRPMIPQLVNAGTSVGANYREADNAESRKDFIHKIGICRKEADESSYWLEIIAIAVQEKSQAANELRKEVTELHHIFNAVVRSAHNKDNA